MSQTLGRVVNEAKFGVHTESQKIRFLEFVNIGRRSADVLFTSVEALLRCTAQDFKNSVVEILSSAP